MSRFPESFPVQLALCAVAIGALTVGAVTMAERAKHSADQEAHQGDEDQSQRDPQPMEPAFVAAVAPEPVAAAPASRDPAPSQPAHATMVDPGGAHGHGDAGTVPIGSVLAGAAVAQSVDSPALDVAGVRYGLGRAALPEEIAAWDIDIRPDGAGLPVGSGDVWTGDEVFAANCAVCHGDFAEGVGRWPVLAGGLGTLTDDRPVKTVGSYWPYLSTVFDYVNRAMPFGYAQSLAPDDVYAITAYILYSNDIVDEDFVLSNENFLEVRLPNEDNFFLDDRAEGEIPAFSQAPCMENCKDSVEIVGRAAILDVTPETEEDASLAPDMTTEAEPEAVQTAAVMPDQGQAAAAPATQPPHATSAEAEVVDAAMAIDPELVAAGERVFRQCSSCHQIGDGARNGVGPALTGIVDAPAGAAEGFRYSGVLEERAAEGLVWTPEELHAFLTDPRSYMRGTRMSFRGLRDEAEVDALIAYLASTGP